MTGCRKYRSDGFTLIELLVVIAIIALLISILLPSLSRARSQAKSVVCGTHIRHVGQAMSTYLADFDGVYPASYVYPKNDSGDWDAESQSENHPYGYVHWSYFLYNNGQVAAESFQCPEFENGGAPRTNPGSLAEDWEPGQVDQNSDGQPNSLEDKQAPRMAYAVNAAIVPRNKFTSELSGGERINRLVRDTRIGCASGTILATEYLNNWKAIGVSSGSGVLSKSHRPINPFYHIGSGFNEYKSPEASSGFIYGLPDDQENYGLIPLAKVMEKVNILDYTSGLAQINAIGRHHPGKEGNMGGTANFVFCDGHVERMTALESVQKRLWGDRYHSISGANEVLNMAPVDNF